MDKQEIGQIINDNNVVLFMKGSKNFPQCGFSAFVAGALRHHNIDFIDINVLESDDLRANIKEYSNWPTIPQLYIKQEFIGGCDIVKEMIENNEFESLLKEKL